MIGNPFKRYRIDRLFFGSFALLVTLVIITIIWISYSLTSRELATTASTNQQKLLNELNNEITSRMVTIEQISLSKSRDDSLLSLLSGDNDEDEFIRYQQFKEVKQSLASLTNSMPLIEGIDVFMNDPGYGDSVSYIQFLDLKEASRQYWAEDIKRNDFAWSDEYKRASFKGEISVISFVRTILYNNKRIGYLVIHLKSELLGQVLIGHSTGEVSRIMLDMSGQPILQIGNVPDAETWADLKAKMDGPSGVFRIEAGNGTSASLFVYARNINSKWTLVEITPWSEITKGSVKLAKVIAVIGALSVLLTLIITMLLSMQFTKPIKKLVGAMNRYSVDGENLKLPDDYRNEFGYLFSGYRKQNERIEQLVQSLRERHELQKKAEMEALQANINPHFLYNTLDQLNWIAITNHQEEISRILELMGRMFRIGLSNGNTFITVKEEIEHLSCYLEIQQIRYKGALQFFIDSPESIQLLYIPKMILQPFVENAVVHGFHNRSNGTVRIRIKQSEGKLVIEIEDDGQGYQPARTPKRKTGGYGIRNVRERIFAHFGGDYVVELKSREEGGTHVGVTLPVLYTIP
ncbi:sensor histidine kinase [Paenibacillus sp. PAMC21692]|uniref:sensor histidine kinase n=1 Tax=Paenibacillus sp. PAMC21692 TaxID=2762320 RepID=UPI0021C3A1A2|nr:sensor histidine kinase [Paenibacillus sp. PAMC21692]